MGLVDSARSEERGDRLGAEVVASQGNAAGEPQLPEVLPGEAGTKLDMDVEEGRH